MVGEPEATVCVEHEVVRGTQRATIAVRVQVGDRASREVDTLDATTDVGGRIEGTWQQQAAEVDRCEATAVVAEVQRAVGADGSTIGATHDVGNRLLGAVGVHAGDAWSEHLDEDHAAVGHGDGSLGETQSVGDLGEAAHERIVSGVTRVQRSLLPRAAAHGTE